MAISLLWLESINLSNSLSGICQTDGSDKQPLMNMLNIPSYIAQESLPSGLPLLTALSILDLATNKLTSLPECEILELKSLQSLDLSNNDIKELPPLMGNMTHIRLGFGFRCGFGLELGLGFGLGFGFCVLQTLNFITRALVLHGNPLRSIRRPVIDKVES